MTVLPELFAGADATTLALVALAAFATALFHAVSGFAGGLLLSVCLAPLLGVKAVVPVVGVALIISNSSRLYLFRHAVDWAAYRAVMQTALPGIVLGSFVYVYLPVAAVAVLLGTFMMLSVPLRRVLRGRNIRVGLRGLALAGAGYGLVSGTVIGAGLLLGPFLLGAGIAGESLVGLVAAFGLTLNVTKTLVFGYGELLDGPMLLAGVLIGLFTVPGAYAGRWLVRRASLQQHTLLVEALLLIGGGYFWYQALG